MKVLVTGGTGFVGGHLVDRLLREGCQVRVLVRKTSRVDRLRPLGVELAEGDLLDENSVNGAVSGCEMVFHCAAYVADWGPREIFLRTDVKGTENVCRASLKNKVLRLIHVSSVDVMDPYQAHFDADENQPYPRRFRDPYTEGKVLSEKLVRQFMEEKALPATIVRPAWIWGPRDRASLPRQIEALRSSTFAWPGGGHNIVGLIHVKDAVEALWRAAQNPKAIGEIYNLCDGTKTTSRQYLTQLAQKINLPVPKLSLPFTMVYGLAAAFELTTRMSRSAKPPEITRYGLTYFIHHEWNAEKIKRDLNFSPKIKLEEGMENMINWWRQEYPAL